MKNRTAVIPFALASSISIACHSSLAADQAPLQPAPAAFTPWLTGPLLAPTGTAVTKGHFTLQPFLFVNVVTGLYNSHWKPISTPNFYNVTLQLEIEIGLTDFMDIEVFPAALYNSTQGQSSTLFGDLPIAFDFQLVSDGKFKWFPGIKLGITETFPTGKYQRLNPKKLDTDVSGLGSFSTAPSLVFYKVYHFSGHHFLSVTASYQYTYYAPVHVKGLSVYESGIGAHGKVYPGGLSTAILSFEYTLNQNWVLALDNVYDHADKDRFKGNPGVIAPGIPAIVGRPSSEQLSFAPAIEYNFSVNLGLIAGIWFSAAGRNQLEFRNGIISFSFSY